MLMFVQDSRERRAPCALQLDRAHRSGSLAAPRLRPVHVQRELQHHRRRDAAARALAHLVRHVLLVLTNKQKRIERFCLGR